MWKWLSSHDQTAAGNPLPHHPKYNAVAAMLLVILKLEFRDV
jgi:hypothetical protein